MPPSSSSPAFPPLLSPDAGPSDKTWEARAVFAAVSTAAVITSEDDEDGEIDVGKVSLRKQSTYVVVQQGEPSDLRLWSN